MSNELLATLTLIVDALYDGENLPLSIRLGKCHVVHPVGCDKFGGSDVSRDVQHADLFGLLCSRKVRRTLETYVLYHLQTCFFPHRDASMNHMLYVVRMQRLLHPTAIAGVIGINLVPDRGPHGGHIVARTLVLFRTGDHRTQHA